MLLQSCSPVIVFFVDCNTWLYSCFVLAHDRTSQDMCSGSGSAAANVGFVTKQANSILGSAFLCCCTICYCKKLPNIMCHCCMTLMLFGICIFDAAYLKQNNICTKISTQKNYYHTGKTKTPIRVRTQSAEELARNTIG